MKFSILNTIIFFIVISCTNIFGHNKNIIISILDIPVIEANRDNIIDNFNKKFRVKKITDSSPILGSSNIDLFFLDIDKIELLFYIEKNSGKCISMELRPYQLKTEEFMELVKILTNKYGSPATNKYDIYWLIKKNMSIILRKSKSGVSIFLNHIEKCKRYYIN